ncbi:MAG: endonuclease III [Bacilli bacterium]|nr:endonuclease III [Bacilli bacterium]
MMKNKSLEIEKYLDYLFPDPKCELNYTNDYELLIAIVLSAQTTDKRVNSVTSVLFDKYPSLEALSKASLADLETILRPLGSFRKKALYVHNIANILHNEYNDIVPHDRDRLENLPGVGRKTVNVFFGEYLGKPAIAVDTHVNRVAKRLGIAKEKDNVLQVEEKLKKCFPKDSWAKIHLQLVLFGRYHCKAKNPNCKECQIINLCKEKKKNL